MGFFDKNILKTQSSLSSINSSNSETSDSDKYSVGEAKTGAVKEAVGDEGEAKRGAEGEFEKESIGVPEGVT